MDMKRFNKITWQEAVVKWSNGEHVFSSTGRTYYMEDDTLHFFLGGEDNGSESTAFFNDITKEEWYVKKPFDVRAEMLARPNEWVGAYGDEHGIWKVGFNTVGMSVVTSQPNGPNGDIKVLDYLFSKDGFVRHSSEELLDACIPIEEVPEGEWL